MLNPQVRSHRSEITGRSSRRRWESGFTLAEMLAACAVLALVVLLMTRVTNHATTVITQGNKHMETESHARPFFDRLAIDIAQMVKRSDISYFLKNASSGPVMGGGSSGVNDRLAFFSGVQGYYAQTGYNSGYSLIAYRVNADPTKTSYNRVERMAKGLPLNGAYSAPAPAATNDVTPLLFFDSVNPGIIAPTTTIDSYWPTATRQFGDVNYYSTDSSQQYELVGPQVFRFEYYYLTTASPSALVAYPTSGFKDPTLTWADANTTNIKDVAAIVVAVAVIDPQSRKLLSDAQMATLITRLQNYTSGGAGALLGQWQTALNSSADMPRSALQGIRVYERYFYLSQ